MRRTVIVAAVLAAVIPTALGGSVAAAAPRHWRASQRQALRAAGAPIPAFLEQRASLVPAGVMKGTTEDVLDEREIGTLGHPTAEGVTARVGATGRVLWQLTLPESKNIRVEVLPERVGRGGKPGVVTLEYGDTPGAGKTRTMTIVLRGYSGANGSLLWRRAFRGTAGPGSAESGVPSFSGVLSAAGDAAPRYLVTRQTRSGPHRTTVADTVSGATGAAIALDSISSTTDYPAVEDGPDLNGDGVGDVLELASGPDGFSRAVSGTDGSTIWTGDEIETEGFFRITTLPHFTSASTPDLALSVFDPDAFTPSVAIVNGRTGHLMWSRPGDFATALGVAGKHRVPAVGIITFGGGQPGRTVTAHVTDRAVTADDTVIYKHEQSVSVAGVAHADSASSLESLGPIGDVQPDGSLDQKLSVTVDSSTSKADRSKTFTGLIDGRTGAFHRLDFQSFADGSLRHGVATDLLGADIAGGHPRVTAWRGATRHRYYRRSVAAVSNMTSAWVDGLRVTGHSCSDISLAAAGHSARALGVLDAAGTPLWTVSFTSKQSVGGTLRHFAKPKHYCV